MNLSTQTLMMSGQGNDGLLTDNSLGGHTNISLPISGDVEKIVYLNDRWFVLGGSSSIHTSYDGENWELVFSRPQSGTTVNSLNSIVYANNKYVAVGDRCVLNSQDGVNWTIVVSDFVNQFASIRLKQVVWNGTFFLGAVITSTSQVNFRKSFDGIVWENLVTTSISNSLSQASPDLIWDGTKFILALSNRDVYFSTDAITWTKNSSVLATDIIWDGTAYIVVNQTNILRSTNFVDWDVVFTFPEYVTLVDKIIWTGTRYVTAGQRYAIGSNLASVALMTSDNGVNWNLQLLRNPEYELQTETIEHIAGINNHIILFGATGNTSSSGKKVETTDGVTWNYIPPRLLPLGRKVSYINNEFITWGVHPSVSFRNIPNNKEGLYTSPTGETWTFLQATAGFNIQTVKWLNNMYIAVGSNKLYYSTDKVNWTTVTITGTDLAFIFYDVEWTGSTYVIVGQGTASDGDPIMALYTSTNLTSWTRRISTAGQRLTGIAWNGTTLVVVGAGRTAESSSSIRTSNASATTWTTRESGIREDRLGIVWGNGKFVIVGTGRSASSVDGINWNYNSLGGSASAVTTDGTRFITVGELGIVRASIDGLTWYNLPIAETRPSNQPNFLGNFFSGVAATPKRIVAVGNGKTLTFPKPSVIKY
jgi:hypothetical protein